MSAEGRLDRLRRASQRSLETLLTPVAAGLHRLGVRPDHVSIAGLALGIAAAALVTADALTAAGVVYLAAGGLDLLDGILARATGTSSRFGAFLDSTLDRASEGVVLAAAAYHFAAHGAPADAGVVVLALLGSYLVSYTRARAEALGAQCKVGFATRAERVLLLAAGLLAGRLTEAVYLVAGLSAITAMQRVLRARRELQPSPR